MQTKRKSDDSLKNSTDTNTNKKSTRRAQTSAKQHRSPIQWFPLKEQCYIYFIFMNQVWSLCDN